MRDRNLPYNQFNIQLEKYILSNLQLFENERITFSQDLSLEFRPYNLHRELEFYFPKNFRSLRTLSIIQWYLPENFHFLLYIQMTDLNLTWLTKKLQLEINILLSSKENCVKYLFLTQRYTSNEIFGNILKNDLKEVVKHFKIKRRYYPKPLDKVYRRGPKDKGSRRVNSFTSIIKEEISKDCIIQTEEIKRNKTKFLLQTTLHKILQILREFES